MRLRTGSFNVGWLGRVVVVGVHYNCLHMFDDQLFINSISIHLH